MSAGATPAPGSQVPFIEVLPEQAVREPVVGAVGEGIAAPAIQPAPARPRWRRELPYLAGILAAYLVSVVVVSPLGRFVLLDGWTYALAVRHLLDDGQLRISQWTATSLVAQVAWGALFASVFGFSFSVLRVSTLVLSFAGSLALYGLCREVGLSRPRALVGATAYWFNPLTFSLSYTFMSDVPAVSFLLLATFFSVRGVRRSSDLALVVGSGFAALAFLVRQPGILFPPAILAYGLLAGWPARLLARRLPLIAGLPALAGVGYLLWVQQQGLPREQQRLLDIVLQRGLTLWQPALLLTGYLLFYLGLFVVPLALGFGPALFRAVARARRPAYLLALFGWVVLVAGLAFFFAWHGGTRRAYASWMPYLKYGGMVQVAGIGPNDLLGERRHFFTATGRIVLTVLSASGLYFLGVAFAQRIVPVLRLRARPVSPVGAVALVGLFQFAGLFPTSAHSLVISWLSFDRYFLPLVPLTIVLTLWATRGLRLSPALVLFGLFGFALFSLAGTQDWLSYNRLRWRIGRDLVARGVRLDQIDAGMEWDGWYLYEYSHQHRMRPRTPHGPFWTRVIAPATDSSYVVAFSPLPGYTVRERRQYPSWLHREPVYLYLLQRR